MDEKFSGEGLSASRIAAIAASFNDKPISEPADDRFGLNPFAQTLAKSIAEMQSPEGMVIALNGPWGSGKSSAVNLILHHLKDHVEAGGIGVVNFACWWFRGEEALTLAFFRELYAGLGPTLGEKFRKVLPKIGARLMRAGSAVGAALDLGLPGAGAAVGGTMSWLSGMIQQDETIEKLHRELVKALSEQSKRFLIVIDDIDRLAPEEALLIFRLVKSVGRLPNVIYLLVFDRKLAETVVTERYPSEGAHYLEKIIQVGFDIPEARHGDLTQQLLEKISELCGQPAEAQIVRFMNVFYDVSAPLVRSPRDLLRLMNALSVSWPAIGKELNIADFVAIEALRVLRPAVYHALRNTKERLCGTGRSLGGREQNEAAVYDRELLGSIEETQREPMRRALRRLFPRLDSVWSNMHYSSDGTWSRERQVCSKSHFDAYFRFSLGDETLPRDEIGELIAIAGDKEAVKTRLRAAICKVRPGGTTRAALLLDELNVHADSVPKELIGSLLSAIFELADDLDVESDQGKGFALASNNLRIHWLLRRLILDRFDLPTRSAIVVAACSAASLGWFVDIAGSAYRNYYPREGKESEREENCLTTREDAKKLWEEALERIRAASKDDRLLQNRDLPVLLYRWCEMTEDDGQEVKEWTGDQLERNDGIVRLAKAFTSYSWSHGMGFDGLGDRVAKRSTRASVESIETIMDRERFRARVEALAASIVLDEPDKKIVAEFLDAWKRRDENPERH